MTLRFAVFVQQLIIGQENSDEMKKLTLSMERRMKRV